MALIGKIRQKKWLLIGSLTSALALFILMLMFDNPNQSFGGSSNTAVGNIAGNTIEYQQFNQIFDMLYSNSQTDSYAGRNFLWNYFVEESLVKDEAEKIGLGVGKEELMKLQFGPEQQRMSILMAQRYQNPNTRAVDFQQLNQMKEIVTTPGRIDQMITEGQLIQDFKYRWAHQEQEVIKDGLQRKLSNLVAKGLYTPTWMGEMIGEGQNKKIDFLYVQVPYDEIENSEVALEDADYEAYFNENKNLYLQDEETRKMEYVVFDVKPSEEDIANIEKTIADLVPKFKESTNDTLFVETHIGTFDGAYFKKDALPATVADTLFAMPVGSVYGPYKDGETFKAVKLRDRKVVPDSVTARHILRPASDFATLQAAQATIDSIKTLIETGINTFEELAIKHSSDGSASKGGDLGTFAPGANVKEFNDVCFFKAELGGVYPVVSQFGVHLIEVTDKKFVTNEPAVQVAYVSRDIVPSQATQDDVKEKALDLQEACKDIEALRVGAASQGLTIEASPGIKTNDYSVGTLGSGQGAREMIRWAFGNSQNVESSEVRGISPQVYSFQAAGQYHVEKYVVTALQSIRPAGLPSYQDVKSDIEAQVINRKKGELIKSQLANITDLSTIAGKYSSKVDTAKNVTFSSASIPGVGGTEPDVVSRAFKTELNQTSSPIAGNTGVFVVRPTNKPEVIAGNAATAKRSSQLSDRGQVNFRLVPSLKKNADIKDNRARFF